MTVNQSRAASVHKAKPLVALLLALALLPAAAMGQTATGGRRIVKQVAEGVALIQETLPRSAENGPLVVSALRVDLKAPGLRVAAALGQDRVWGADATKGREIVSALARRRGAVAGVNGGYFPFAGNPIGLHVENGDLVTEPNQRVVFALDEKGRARFDRFRWEGGVRAETGQTFPIHGLNRPPGRGNELLLYTPRFFSATLPQAGRFEAILSGVPGPLKPGTEYRGTVAAVRTGGGAELAAGTVVLSGGAAAAEWLRDNAQPGWTIRFRIDLDPSDVREAVAGGPRLLQNGRIAIDWAEEGFPASFARERHPRTAVGLSRDGGTLLLVTVDGRQPALSRGATLGELAVILLKLGAADAINLDGGGSTALVVRDAVVNSPSEGRERPVANALLVFVRAQAASPKPPLPIDGVKSSPPGVGDTQVIPASGNRQSP